MILCTDLKMMKRERDKERERRQNVSLHECMHIHLVVVPHGNSYETLTYHPVVLLDKS